MYDLKFTSGGFLDFRNDIVNFRTNEIGPLLISLNFWASSPYFVRLVKLHLNLVNLISSRHLVFTNHFGHIRKLLRLPRQF